MFGPDPMNTVCPNCHNNITTATTEEIGVMAWIAAVSFALLFVGRVLLSLSAWTASRM